MILYHFCPAHMKNAILSEGLTKGAFPLMESGGFAQNVQWLTSERDPKKQTWATQKLISYSRTAYRLTIHIPDSRHKKLRKALEWVAVFPEGDRKIVTEWPGSEAWYVYLGKIPQKWIVGCRRMEGTPQCT